MNVCKEKVKIFKAPLGDIFKNAKFTNLQNSNLFLEKLRSRIKNLFVFKGGLLDASCRSKRIKAITLLDCSVEG